MNRGPGRRGVAGHGQHRRWHGLQPGWTRRSTDVSLRDGTSPNSGHQCASCCVAPCHPPSHLIDAAGRHDLTPHAPDDLGATGCQVGGLRPTTRQTITAGTAAGGPVTWAFTRWQPGTAGATCGVHAHEPMVHAVRACCGHVIRTPNRAPPRVHPTAGALACADLVVCRCAVSRRKGPTGVRRPRPIPRLRAPTLRCLWEEPTGVARSMARPATRPGHRCRSRGVATRDF
ncbi:hypothetical protein SAMN05216561_1135 [Nocardioides psychrotolerans]|uniref:Uncharacterized protein n=1 Tax=Nocardioides psychrotolerans TaxID=1005945 RepID=A0A1I3L3E9_9ACTN|nr:hypothetical protein SAMN05216561_1135 [Nocardioides psychrotolerans]